MSITNGGLISSSSKTTQQEALALSDGLACFTGSFSGVTTTSISHGLNSTDLVVEFKDSLGNLLIPDNWSITNPNVIEAEFSPAATGDVTIIACIESGLAPITGGVILLEGLSGIIDLDCPDGSVNIGTSGQVINICALFTPESGALLEQKCRDIDILSGLIGGGSGTTVNGISGAVIIESVNDAIDVITSGNTILLSGLFTSESGAIVEQKCRDIDILSGLIENIGSGIDTQTSINGLSGTLFMVGVSGVDVTTSGTDTIVVSANPSGITNIIQEVGFSGLFGGVLTVNTADQSTNSAAFIEALSLSITTSGGLYRIGWTVEGEVDSDGKIGRYQVQLDDTTTLMSICPSFSEEDSPEVFSSFDYQPLDEGTHAIDLDFAVADTGVINTIRRARIEAWRVGDINA